MATSGIKEIMRKIKFEPLFIIDILEANSHPDVQNYVRADCS